MSRLDKHKEAAREVLSQQANPNHPLVQIVAQALATLEAATEARVRRECAEIAKTEPEPKDQPPPEIMEAMIEAGPVLTSLAAVRATKKSIAERILASGDTTNA